MCGTLGLAGFAHSLWTSQLRFPSFTFLTHLLALVLSVIIGCTMMIRAITLIFTHGYIPSPIWRSLLPHEGALPSVEDDIGVALLKLGVTCIETTQFSGLRNELAPIAEPQPQVRLTGDNSVMLGGATGASSGFGARIDKIEAVELRDPNAESPYLTQLARFWEACIQLVHNVFWTMLLSTWVGRDLYRLAWRMYQGRWWYGPREWQFWRAAAWDAPPRRRVPREPPLLIAWAIAKARRQTLARMSRQRLPEPTIVPHDVAQAWAYDEVLRGEVEVEDDDGDADDWRSEGTSASAESFSEGEEDEALLYRDLVHSDYNFAEGEEDEAASSAIQPILLAHLTSTSSSPLTRRRYAQILSSGPGPTSPSPSTVATTADPLQAAITARQSETAAVPRNNADEWDEERRHSCVICMVQTRDVILWPCRCLLMCSDCRESLAARLSAKDHVCPNCRTKVEGYSRIYVP